MEVALPLVELSRFFVSEGQNQLILIFSMIDKTMKRILIWVGQMCRELRQMIHLSHGCICNTGFKIIDGKGRRVRRGQMKSITNHDDLHEPLIQYSDRTEVVDQEIAYLDDHVRNVFRRTLLVLNHQVKVYCCSVQKEVKKHLYRFLNPQDDQLLHGYQYR